MSDAEHIGDVAARALAALKERREAICPSCGSTERIYAGSNGLCSRYECGCPLGATAEEGAEHRRQRLAKALQERTAQWESENTLRASRAGVPNRYRLARYADLAAPMRSAISAAFQADRWVYFYGPCGTGKTHTLAALIRNHAVERNRAGGLMVSAADLMGETRDAMDEMTDRTVEEVIRFHAEAPFLALDDFGAERGTPWAEEVMFRLIDRRYADERLTAIASNIRRQDIGNARIASRLGECADFVTLTKIRKERGGKAT